MLNELYTYAISHGLAAQVGFKKKKVVCYVMLDASGRFLGFAPSPSKETYAPDIGSAANGSRYCNPLVEKALYPLFILTGDAKKDKNTPVKRDFFLETLLDSARDDERFAVVHRVLQDESAVVAIREAYLNKYKAADPIGFEVDGTRLEDSPACGAWWARFRARFQTDTGDSDLPRCLITGEPAPPLATVPKVSGLFFVGGHASGDAFLCFDKDAFQSYGFKKAANASVSEDAITAVNAALGELLQNAETFGGAKMVYWYSQDIQKQVDPIPRLMNFDFDDEDDKDDDQPQDQPRPLIAPQNADDILTAVYDGLRPEQKQARYYIMPLSGMSGRVMVRGWYEGSFEALYRSTIQWFDDLRLVTPGGKSHTRAPKLKALCIRLLKPGGDPKKVFDRMDKELAALLWRVFHAAVSGELMPDAVAVKTLYWLRSSMLKTSDEDAPGGAAPETLAYQLLKAWLIRRQRAKGEVYMACDLNKDYPGVAYHCGRMMAVFAAVQAEAMKRDVGASVVDRYYGAAISAPRTVLGTLSRQANYHLSKIDNKAFAIRFQRMLGEIASHMDSASIPALLNTTQQTEFALGYYQQQAAIYQKATADETETQQKEEQPHD